MYLNYHAYKMIEEVSFLLEEMDAYKRRLDALSKGIIPIAGSNWNAARKNKKLLNRINNVRNDAEAFNAQLDKLGANDIYGNNYEYMTTVDPRGKYSGKTLLFNKDGAVETSDPYQINLLSRSDTVHLHPFQTRERAENLIKERFSDSDLEGATRFRNYANNNIVVQPSGELDKNGYKNGDRSFAIGDYGVFSGLGQLRNQPYRNDYIVSPEVEYSPVSVTRTTPTSQKTTYFANNKAKDYFDLNGNLKVKNFDVDLNSPSHKIHKFKSKAKNLLNKGTYTIDALKLVEPDFKKAAEAGLKTAYNKLTNQDYNYLYDEFNRKIDKLKSKLNPFEDREKIHFLNKNELIKHGPEEIKNKYYEKNTEI